jgi:hypothetical protein
MNDLTAPAWLPATHPRLAAPFFRHPEITGVNPAFTVIPGNHSCPE